MVAVLNLEPFLLQYLKLSLPSYPVMVLQVLLSSTSRELSLLELP